MSGAISLPFSFNVEGGISSTTDSKKIIQDRVVLIVMTLLGERVMRPSFGTNTRQATFESLSTASTLIKQQVNIGFSDWLPYLSLNSVDVSLDTDYNLNININYTYGSSPTAESVVIKTATLNSDGTIITEVPYGQ